MVYIEIGRIYLYILGYFKFLTRTDSFRKGLNQETPSTYAHVARYVFFK